MAVLALLVVPSPKFQAQEVALPVEVLAKLNVVDVVPLVGLALKLATGAVDVRAATEI